MSSTKKHKCLKSSNKTFSDIEPIEIINIEDDEAYDTTSSFGIEEDNKTISTAEKQYIEKSMCKSTEFEILMKESIKETQVKKSTLRHIQKELTFDKKILIDQLARQNIKYSILNMLKPEEVDVTSDVILMFEYIDITGYEFPFFACQANKIMEWNTL